MTDNNTLRQSPPCGPSSCGGSCDPCRPPSPYDLEPRELARYVRSFEPLGGSTVDIDGLSDLQDALQALLNTVNAVLRHPEAMASGILTPPPRTTHIGCACTSTTTVVPTRQ